MAKKAAQTPMMKQYFEIKAKYPDAFLFYRLGDFYEMFYDDAIKAAKILELTLTSRNKNSENPIPMCGVPHHSAQNYIDTLIEEGYKVAICEQVEDPKLVKAGTTVKREVTQLITPGTNIEPTSIEAKTNNYLVALLEQGQDFALAYADLSTGELKTTLFHDEELVFSECSSLQTKEILRLSPLTKTLEERLRLQLNVLFSDYEEQEETSESNFLSQNIQNPLEIKVLHGLIHYLEQTQKRHLDHLQKAEHYEVSQYLKMDYDSKFNLELTQNIRTGKKKGTLLWLLDKTATAMGGRLLKRWIEKPLIQRQEILARQDRVQSLIDAFFERSELKQALTEVYDLERLVGRVSFGVVNAREMIQLKTSLMAVPRILDLLKGINHGEWTPFLGQLDTMDDLVDLLNRAILEDANVSLTEGHLIKPGYNATLDRYLDAMQNGKKWLAEMEKTEREATGIHNLKIGYNRNFGYYIEVTKAALSKLPEDRYERKQTLANAERFTTPKLKELETTILEAEESSRQLEYELFVEVRDVVKSNIERLQKLAKAIAEIDIMQSFAEVSETYQYVRPTISENQVLNIEGGRHPVVERVMNEDLYIANDLYLDQDKQMLLITGPNMSGKSTYMRQLALSVIMMQMGCYVPAEHAEIPIFDQIFTRIGASDNLISGQSTFMVEMMEANHALLHATPNSLILFDELGRGTATYDGMALAQSIIEYIHNHIHAKTLFSTHYHELTALEESLPHLENVHVEAVEKDGDIIFMHKIQEGPADKSYGIHVAKIAGLPDDLLQRAQTLLDIFEGQNVDVGLPKIQEQAPVEALADGQLSLFDEEDHHDIVERLRKANLMTMTPLEAMNLLAELQKDL